MNIKTTISLVLILSLGFAPILVHGKQAGKVTAPVKPKKKGRPDEQTTRNYFTDLPLLTQEGKHVRFYTDVLKDRVVLINFIYANCRDACPLITQKLAQVKGRLGDLFGTQVYFVSISSDPNRDTPQALAKFAKQQKVEHPGWLFLTGKPNNLKQIVGKLGQYSPDFQSHSTLMLAGNVKTAHWAKIPPNAPPALIAERLRLLVEDD